MSAAEQSTAEVPQLALQSSIEFLRHWDEGPWVLTAINPETRKIETRAFWPKGADEAVRWIEGHQRGKHNIYFSVNRVHPDAHKKKATKAQVTEVVALHVDIDLVGGRNEEEEAAIRDKLKQRAPTVTIFSGGGFQGLWRLDKPLKAAEDRNGERVEMLNKGLIEKLDGDPACWNIDRILRLPGTINFPDARKAAKGRVPALARVVAADWDRRTTPALPAVDEPAAEAQADDAADDVHHLPGATPTDDLPQWLQSAIKTGKTKNSGTDRSRAVYAVASGLVRCGWDDKAIAAVLLNRNNKISEHVLKQVAGYAMRQAAQAREDETEHRAKQARKAAIPPNKIPIALGMTQEIRFAIAAHNTINTFSAQQLTTKATLLSLVTSNEYWTYHYPHPEVTGAFDAGAAGVALMAQCERAGPFDPSRIRGRGVWREGDKIIVNFGDPIPSDVRHHYVCFDPLPITAGGEVEVQRLFKLLKMFRWRNKADPLLFLGLAACMPVCGALRWRPHGWLAGPRNAGKSTLVHLLTAITSPLSMALSGNTSEAGVRQSVGYDARGLIIDEFEQNEHVDSILGLARIASSGDVVVRGSGDGRPVRYQAFMMFLFASITIRGMGVADSTRIVRLELEKHTSKLKTRRKIESEVAYFERLGGDAWCRMMIDRLPVLLETINVIEGHVSADDDRHRKNMATLLAGGWIALHGRVPSGQEGRKFAQKAATTTAVHAEELVERDQDMECLARLFAHQVRSNNRGTYPLGHWIGVVAREFTEDRVGETVEEVIDARSIVASHDMRVEKDGLLIKNGSVAIDRIFEDTEWARGAWKQALRRIPGAGAVAKVVKFLSGANIPARATLIPFDLLPEPIDTNEEPM